jgi:hypothetical protein
MLRLSSSMSFFLPLLPLPLLPLSEIARSLYRVQEWIQRGIEEEDPRGN